MFRQGGGAFSSKMRKVFYIEERVAILKNFRTTVSSTLNAAQRRRGGVKNALPVNLEDK